MLVLIGVVDWYYEFVRDFLLVADYSVLVLMDHVLLQLLYAMSCAIIVTPLYT